MGGRGKRTPGLTLGGPVGNLNEQSRQLVRNVQERLGRPSIAAPRPLTGNSKQASYLHKKIQPFFTQHGYTVKRGNLPPGRMGQEDHTNRTITIRKGLSYNQVAQSEFHAADHVQQAVGRASRPSRWKREVEASAVAHLVSHHFGINTGSYNTNYIARWIKAGGSAQRVEQRARYVESRMPALRQRAQQIINHLES